MIVREKYQGVDESPAIIMADIRDGKYCLHAEKYFADKQAKNEEPDFDEWFEEHNNRLEQFKDDLAGFYEIKHLPLETIEKVFDLAWNLAMEDFDEEEATEEERTAILEEVAERFAMLADLFKI